MAMSKALILKEKNVMAMSKAVQILDVIKINNKDDRKFYILLISLYSLIIAGIINLGLNFLFIPRYGYFAAAITTLVSYAFLLFLMVVLSRRFFFWKFPFKSLVKVTLASAIMGIVMNYLRNSLTPSILINLICSVSVGGLIYFVLLFLFREFQSKEREGLKQIFKKKCYLSKF